MECRFLTSRFVHVFCAEYGPGILFGACVCTSPSSFSLSHYVVCVGCDPLCEKFFLITSRRLSGHFPPFRDFRVPFPASFPLPFSRLRPDSLPSVLFFPLFFLTCPSCSRTHSSPLSLRVPSFWHTASLPPGLFPFPPDFSSPCFRVLSKNGSQAPAHSLSFFLSASAEVCFAQPNLRTI